MNQFIKKALAITGVVALAACSSPLSDLEINDAIVQQAEAMAPYVQDVVDGRSGYDTTRFWIAPAEEDGSILLVTADEGEVTTDAGKESADVFYGMPVEKIDHYLSGDGIPPNGAPVLTLTSFPATPVKGEYVLRVDYMPNRLYIFNGKKWVYVEDNVRMQITNYTDRYTYKTKNFNDKTSITLADGTKLDSKQSLSNVLRAREDEE